MRAILPRLLPFAACALALLAGSPARADSDTYSPFPPNPLDAWWQPGSGAALSDFVQYRDPGGMMGIINGGGWFNTQHHPFFEPLGPNGRACVTCHQPSQGMSLGAANIRYRWQLTKGQDPLFAAVDGSNCPTLSQAQESAHSLLLDRGVFRVALPMPRKAQFKIAVVNDPPACNGPASPGKPPASLSVYRRPRVVANFPNPGNGCANDPKAAIMADGRAATLRDQALDAAHTHLEMKTPPSDAQLAAIVAFECQVYAAQASDGQDVFSVPGNHSNLGPENMRLAMQVVSFLKKPNARDEDTGFQHFDPGVQTTDANNRRASIARGAELFANRTFPISGAVGVNANAKAISGTCATCHDVAMSGMSSARFIDTGSTNQPWAIAGPDLPLFKVICDAKAPAHPFLGRVIYTQDPGRALTTGKCADVGAIMVQQLRGLAARAPYFSNGSAQTLDEVVDFYDHRFNAHFTAQEKQDLVSFLSVL